MPELPEVETIRRELEPELIGRRIERLRVRRPDILLGPWTPGRFRQAVEGATIGRVERRGKSLAFHLDRDRVLEVQVRMTGRFAVGRILACPAEFRHIAAEFDLSGGRTLFYDDVRRLGGFQLLDTAGWERRTRRLGPEPLEPGFTARRLAAAFEGSRAPVKNLLLDQSRLAGVGNIYASESLHMASIDPRRPARELREEEIRRLHRALRRVLRQALESAGTTFRDYRSVNGRPGGFQRRLRVYGREGQGCRRCATPIRRIVQAGRSSFFCPACQR
ncbi:MAG: bifunctional DNA-formamidopyrimidine glycosylase/DNA-(apurinic or apyrimidinic site) lyase [Gemmatimonadota bacterium]